MSDQPIDPLGETARTCLRMEMASPKVAECQKIVERLMSVKVRIMPARAGQPHVATRGRSLRRRVRALSSSR